MRLVDNWRTIIRNAWSIRLILLAGFLSGLEVALPYFTNIPSGLFSVLTLGVTASAFVARLVAQKKIGGSDE